MNQDDRYHLTLGRFIDAFATAEHNLKFALAASAGIPREIAQAIFSGVKVDQAISFITRIYEARSVKPPDEVAKALVHMSTIRGVRNDIVHYGSFVDGDEFVTTTAPHTLPSKAKTNRYSIVDLDHMTNDLIALGHRFMWVIVKDNPAAFPEAVSRLDEIARTPWRYKSQ